VPNEVKEPSQLAIDWLLSRIEADESIPAQIKQVLSSAVSTRSSEQLEILRASLAEWADNDESPEHPAE
jgi:hypothetical protein